MDDKICTSCNHQNKTGNYFCTQCGSKLRMGREQRSRLSLVDGEPNGAIFLLKQGRNPIGRDAGNVIVLGDQQISNKHATITHEEDGYWIEDRQSKNGVYVNGKRVAKERLQDGSVIRIGSTVLKFDENSQSSS